MVLQFLFVSVPALTLLWMWVWIVITATVMSVSFSKVSLTISTTSCLVEFTFAFKYLIICIYRIDCLLETYHITTKLSVQHHPVVNGILERKHQPLIEFFRKMPKNANWRNYVDTSLWVGWANIRRSTGYSPQYLVYGFQSYADLNLLHDPIAKKITLSPVRAFQIQIQTTIISRWSICISLHNIGAFTSSK